MKKILFYAIALALVIGATIAIAMYFKPHKNIAKAKPFATLAVADWLREFDTNIDTAHKRYFEQVVEISGPVDGVQQTDSSSWEISFLSDGGSYDLSCSLEEEEKNIPQVEQNIVLKCLYVGYTTPTEEFELPGEVKCRGCVVVN